MALSRAQWGLLGSVALPVGLFILLNLLRPDLWSPLLDGPLGPLFISGLGLVEVIHGIGLYVAFVLLNRTKARNVWTVVLTLLSFFLVTLPTCFAVLFAPILWTFMHQPP